MRSLNGDYKGFHIEQYGFSGLRLGIVWEN